MRNTSGSRRISSAMASRKASRMVIVTISVPAGTSGSGSAAALGAAGGGRGGGGRLRRRRFVFRRGCGFRLGGGRRRRGGFLLFHWRAGLAGIISAFAVGQNGRDRRIDRDISGPFRDQDLAKRALIGGFDFHRRLVGFDLGDDIARLDGLALLLQPL